MSLTPEKRAEMRITFYRLPVVLELLDALDERDAEVERIAEVGAYAAAREEMANARQRSIADLRRARDAIRERDAALAEVARLKREVEHLYGRPLQVDLMAVRGQRDGLSEQNATLRKRLGAVEAVCDQWEQVHLNHIAGPIRDALGEDTPR